MARLSSGDRQSVSSDYSRKVDTGNIGLDADALYGAIQAALSNENTRKAVLALGDDRIETLISVLSDERKTLLRERIAEHRAEDRKSFLRRFGLR